MLIDTLSTIDIDTIRVVIVEPLTIRDKALALCALTLPIIGTIVLEALRNNLF